MVNTRGNSLFCGGFLISNTHLVDIRNKSFKKEI